MKIVIKTVGFDTAKVGTWDKYNIPMISAHISCCNYPRPRNLLEVYKENLPPSSSSWSCWHTRVCGAR